MADVDHLLFVRDMFGIGEATRGIARCARHGNSFRLRRASTSARSSFSSGG